MSFDITKITTTDIVQNPTYPYYTNTVEFRFFNQNGNIYLNLSGNGTPFPAKAGNNPDAVDGGFTNDGITPLVWVNNPNSLVDQNYNFNIIYRGGTNSENPQKMQLGIQGMFANGVALYTPSAGIAVPELTNLKYTNTITGQNNDFNAVFFEEFYSIDKAGGHCSAEGPYINGMQGQYHYHDGEFLEGDAWNNPKFYNTNAYFSTDYYTYIDPNTETLVQDNFRDKEGHSKIVGICFDGYPIYGPYGYSEPLNNKSTIIPMTSSYILNPTEFLGRPYTYTDVFDYTDEYGNEQQIIIGPGAYMDDYTFIKNTGTLDEFNGRYCVTPEYPNGTFAYFSTNSFPFLIGNYSKNQRILIPPDPPCFREGTKILTIDGYQPIETLKIGDLIKTLKGEYRPIIIIGKSTINHSASKDRIKNQFYIYKKEKNNELIEDLIITGGHSILVDDFKNTYEENKNSTYFGGLNLTIDNKYLLLACVDKDAEVYDIPGIYNIYHIALDGKEDIPYGIFANGLLVESCCPSHLRDKSFMKLIHM